MTWKGYEKTVIKIGRKLNQTREIKQEFKLIN